ncbi:MAG: zincin-like metallopeptidase domain-containing protein [Planctomycetaceae bacterium]
MTTTTRATTRTKTRRPKAKTTSGASRPDVYTRVTGRIVEQLEAGIRPWLKPWNAEHATGRITRPLRSSGAPYRGINILMLWDAAESAGYGCPIWLTFRQAQELGGHVRKGEKSSPVVYASRFKKTEADDDGRDVEREIPFLKQYAVFNAEQCEGLPDQFYALKQAPNSDIERIAAADRFCRNTGADIREGGNQACYVQSLDQIRMPKLETFVDAESHAATLSHELVHWTKNPARLNRDLGRKKWGDAGYAMEELVAELGAAFLCADLAITPDVRDDHADYIGHWLQVLKNDTRAVFSAASMASAAVDYLHGLQPKPVE